MHNFYSKFILKTILVDAVGTIMAPKDVHMLILLTYEDVMLHGKREMRLQMEIGLLIS